MYNIEATNAQNAQIHNIRNVLDTSIHATMFYPSNVHRAQLRVEFIPYPQVTWFRFKNQTKLS